MGASSSSEYLCTNYDKYDQRSKITHDGGPIRWYYVDREDAWEVGGACNQSYTKYLYVRVNFRWRWQTITFNANQECGFDTYDMDKGRRKAIADQESNILRCWKESETNHDDYWEFKVGIITYGNYSKGNTDTTRAFFESIKVTY